MALEAVVYQQDQLFTHSAKDFYSLLACNSWDSTSIFDYFPSPENQENLASVSLDNFLDNQTENCFHQILSNSNPNSSLFTQILHNYPYPDHANGNNVSENNLATNSPTDLHENQENPAAISLDNFLDSQTENCFHQILTNSNSSSSLFTQILHNYPSRDHGNSDNVNANNLATNSPTDLPENPGDLSSSIPAARAKRRRSRSRKNKEEIENQRMTHIAVERNRRKQMNEYLSILRSLMPESYVQRGDQASIIGGAINFVKVLEQRLQLIGGKKEITGKCDGADHVIEAPANPLPFSEFFAFPQYSTSLGKSENLVAGGGESASQSAVADIEVTMVESHASLKIRLKRQPKQLLKVVSGLHALHLTILHLNVSTVEQIVLYSLSLKVEEDCKLSSVDEIATAVYEMLGRIEEEYCMAN